MTWLTNLTEDFDK